MNKLADKALATQLMLTAFVAGAMDRMRSDERGQGSVEYVGIIIVVVAIIGVVVLAKTDVGNAIKTQLVNAVNTIGA
jgi:Flp pilus assembly pilin Flp